MKSNTLDLKAVHRQGAQQVHVMAIFFCLLLYYNFVGQWIGLQGTSQTLKMFVMFSESFLSTHNKNASLIMDNYQADITQQVASDS